MLGFDAAIALLEKHIGALPAESVGLEDAAGRYLSEDLHARTDAPRCDVSAMDGYAVIESGTRPGQSLHVIGEARPGAPCAETLAHGQCVRIFTGAPIPQGADCVIMQEYAVRHGSEVEFREGYGPARHIRRAGGDFRSGDRLLAHGARLTPQAMVAAAAADRASVSVSIRPRIAIIATGDELVPPGSAHASAVAIPESASFGVAALAQAMGAMVVSRQHGWDEIDSLAALAKSALAKADCVIVTGGASVGDHDLAKPMFAQNGMELLFSKLAIKPGKPVWCGLVGDKPVLGLPGNPTSAMVTARLFLAPLLGLLQGGDAKSALGFLPMPLAEPLEEVGDRELFVRAHADSKGLETARNQESGAQSPLARSDWLIRRPAGSPVCEAGSLVEALPFGV